MTTLETELVRKAQSGDMAAFTELVQRHDRAVFSLAARYVQSADDAKDIFQEVMIRIFRGLPKFRLQSEFGTWVHRITVNVCLSHKARFRTTFSILLEPGEGGEAETAQRDIPSGAEGPDQAAINADIAEHVRQALQTLSPQQRMVFTLRHYEGHSLKEIAATLHCTEGTVKRYLFTATRRMRTQLQGLL